MIDRSKDYEDPDVEQEWCAHQRSLVMEYLTRQLKHAVNAGEWPAWHIAPYVAVWAVESVVQPGAIGWWAFSGDLPTDYISSADVLPPQHPRKAMRVIADRWQKMANAWNAGIDFPDCTIGDAKRHHELAPLLAARAQLLLNFADTDDFWPE